MRNVGRKAVLRNMIGRPELLASKKGEGKRERRGKMEEDPLLA